MEEDNSGAPGGASGREEFLRQAARTFGELAERLSNELHAIRREVRRPYQRPSIAAKTRPSSPSACR